VKKGHEFSSHAFIAAKQRGPAKGNEILASARNLGGILCLLSARDWSYFGYERGFVLEVSSAIEV
jgi:hypothetical protein